MSLQPTVNSPQSSDQPAVCRLSSVVCRAIAEHPSPAIWDDDHSALVQALMDQIPIAKDDIVRQVITEAYASGYEKDSDGITLLGQLEFQGFSFKHPLGVGHDRGYYLGLKSPFLPKAVTTDWQAQLWYDNWIYRGCKLFGHQVLAPFVWFGLRCGGWRAWQIHRQNGDPQPITPQEIAI